MMGLEVQIWQDCTAGFLCHPHCYTVTPPCPTFLPSPQYIEEAAQTHHNYYGHDAPCPMVTWIHSRAPHEPEIIAGSYKDSL